MKIKIYFQQLHSQIYYKNYINYNNKNQNILLNLILNKKYHIIKYTHNINIHSINKHKLLKNIFYFILFILNLSIFKNKHIY